MMNKYTNLLSILQGMDSTVIAYSGGVDSTLVVKAVRDSGIRALAVTGKSPTTPPLDLSESISMTAKIGLPHRIIETAEMDNPDFRKNSTERCFFCKDTLFGELRKIAGEEGYQTVIEGSNLDDLQDHRPGMRAGDLHMVRRPLIEAGITKSDVREISRSLGLRTWKRASSPCLSSRFAYGIPIDEEPLSMVDRAESFLREHGFIEFRLRHHGETARIEVREDEIGRFLDDSLRKRLLAYLMELGYKYVTLDLEGFRSGKMNR